MPLRLSHLTPIALIGYRNELQHEQQKSISTINLQINALRAWCASNSQVNALLRQAQVSRDPARNYAIMQVLLQTGVRLSECSGLTCGDITIGERSGMLLVRAGKGNKV